MLTSNFSFAARIHWNVVLSRQALRHTNCDKTCIRQINTCENNTKNLQTHYHIHSDRYTIKFNSLEKLQRSYDRNFIIKISALSGKPASCLRYRFGTFQQICWTIWAPMFWVSRSANIYQTIYKLINISYSECVLKYVIRTQLINGI